MPRIAWENNILGFVPRTDWLDVGFEVTRPNDPADANGDCNGDGYTNIEKYINAIPTQTKVDWRNLNNNYDTLAEKGKVM